MIEVVINGEACRVADGERLTDLLARLELPAQRVAVELNLDIIPRARWAETVLADGDRLEIVHFVGGG